EHDDLRRRHTPRSNARDATLGPIEPPVPTSRQLARRAVPRRRDHQPAEPVLVAAPRELAPVGGPRVRTLPGAPRRLGMLALLDDHGPRARTVGVGDPQCRPTLGIRDEREVVAGGREPRLTG